MANPYFLLLFISILIHAPPLSTAQRTLSSFSISDSPWRPLLNQTLISPNSVFAAGFLALPSSPNLFNFSVWYRNVSASAGYAAVWSANPTTPVGPSASLTVTAAGALRLLNSTSSAQNLWPGNASAASNTTRLTLRDDGNLMYGSWNSFFFPTNTILPNQSMDQSDNITLVSDNLKFRFINSSQLVFNKTDTYQPMDNAFISFDAAGKMTLANSVSFIVSDFGLNRSRRLTLDNDGILRIYSYDARVPEWTVVWQSGYEVCKVHGSCGPNAICVSDGSSLASNCVCPPGFKPLPGGAKDQGCQRKIPLTNKTKFLRLDYVNFTGGSNQTNWFATNISVCESRCLTRPNCLGYAFKYDGLGYCVLQLDRMLYGYWSPGSERAMFLRVDKSETDQSNFTGMTELLETTCPVQISLPLPPEESNATTRNIVIICTLFAAELISGVLFFWAFIKKYIKYRDMARTLGLEFLPAGGPKRFSYAELKAATKDFTNLIGRGGFGDVYRGELTDQRVVAVKCLKANHVAGGDGEFWAEVTIIARMHHLNLVRLWGFCAEKGQRILVYEYVPNGSLDKHLFHSGRVLDTDETSEEIPILDWGIRYRIALGVARSIAYLHEECLEWVLHCDIKPENILLGDDFCPKISDFGLAKLKKKEDMVSISRMQGTRGYMAPEWVKMDPITPKADVYSFGMVLLELVSGVRNNDIQGGSMIESEDWYFPRWAFDKVFKEMNVEDILDRHIKHCYDSKAHFDTVNRMVKTAMWCLQDRPEMRPSMGKVAKMLEGTVDITEPKKPTIFYLSDD